MHNLHLFNPAVNRNIGLYAKNKNWQGLENYFSGLSNTDFRTACNMMSADIMPQWEETDYWDCFMVLFNSNAKAWLVTMLKAAVKKYNDGSLSFNGDTFKQLCRIIREEKRKIDERKLLQNVLPILKTPEEIETIFLFLQLEDKTAARYLVECDTMACYFVLFQKMKRMDNAPEYLSLLCAELIRKGGNKAFNFVSMIKNYFDLPAIKGVFSLKINPYELSRLDASFGLFCQMLNRI